MAQAERYPTGYGDTIMTTTILCGRWSAKGDLRVGEQLSFQGDPNAVSCGVTGEYLL
ncbi:hypothetical protein [Nannocystis sp.]|uniref:hypothetical protein n=1 Tax=Nannocystis sp. TaxID=1962667 RepID=UPI0025EC0A11|nr:hypothetical protein [Nannocystis sp.]